MEHPGRGPGAVSAIETEAVVETILAAVRAGLRRKDVAKLVGLSADTLRRWVRRGEAAAEVDEAGVEPVAETERPYLALVRRWRAVEQQAILEAAQRIQEAGRGYRTTKVVREYARDKAGQLRVERETRTEETRRDWQADRYFLAARAGWRTSTGVEVEGEVVRRVILDGGGGGGAPAGAGLPLDLTPEGAASFQEEREKRLSDLETTDIEAGSDDADES